MTTSRNSEPPLAARPIPFRAAIRLRSAAALAATLVLCAPAAASAAGTVQLVVAAPNTTLQFTAGAGDANAVTVTQNASAFTIADSGAIITTSDPACSGGGTNAVTCTSAAITRIGAALGDGNDAITNNSAIGSVFDGGAGVDMLTGSAATTNAGRDVSIRGGDGDDTIDGRAGADSLGGDLGSDHLIGGDGQDSLVGRTTAVGAPGDGGDLLEGGPGVDSLAGGSGSDVLFGGPDVDELDGEEDGDVVYAGGGDDRFRETRDGAVDQLFGDAGDDEMRIDRFPFGAVAGPDVLDGGAGIDEVTLTDVSLLFPPFEPSPPAGVSLDDAASNDGFEGQPVTLLNVEDAFIDALGGSADVVRGSDGANALTTGAGNDVVDGLAGTDVISLGDGADLLEARDGYSDRISCGPGGDSAAVDQLDDVSDCESVTTTFVAPAGIVAPPDIVPPPAPPPPPGAPPPPPVTPRADTSAPRCRISAPATIRTLRGGVRVTATCDEAAALELTLSARVTSVRARAAAVGELELATRSLPLRSGARTVRLTVSARLRRSVGPRATLRVGLRARDAAGNGRTTSKTIRLRATR